MELSMEPSMELAPLPQEQNDSFEQEIEWAAKPEAAVPSEPLSHPSFVPLPHGSQPLPLPQPQPQPQPQQQAMSPTTESALQRVSADMGEEEYALFQEHWMRLPENRRKQVSREGRKRCCSSLRAPLQLLRAAHSHKARTPPPGALPTLLHHCLTKTGALGSGQRAR